MASEHAIHPAAGQPAVPLARRRTARSKHGLAPWLLLTPWLIGLFAITLGPMVASLYLSFTNYNLLGQLRWVGLNNYVELLTDDPRFYQAAGVTKMERFIQTMQASVVTDTGKALLDSALRIVPSEWWEAFGRR